jgi:tetratricopeptide (TPR) repeat protein
MERNTQVLGNNGARERLVLRSSNPFMQPLMSHKKVASIISFPVPSTSSPPKNTETLQRRKVSITFEQEQAAIAARNEREERQCAVTQHHKLALKANNMGVFHERIGRTEKALQCYQVGLKALHETKGFKTPKSFPFSSCLSTVVPQSPKTPIVMNVKKDESLTDERTLLTAVIMCNLASMYRRNGQLGRAMEFYNLAYKTVASCGTFCETEESEKLQARLFEYIESNVKLTSDEEGLHAYDESDEDEDCSEDEMES